MVILLLVAMTLCVFAVSMASAGGVRATNPTLSLGQRAQGTGLIWGGNKGPAPPPPTMAIGQRFANFADLVDQITRPSWRRFPGLGWWGDMLQLD